MKFFSKLVAVLALLITFVAPRPAMAGEATAQLSATLNEFITILVNTSVAELRAHGLPDRALNLVYGRFDFSEMTKRSLGSHWKSLAAAEQREFVDAFTQRLLRAYGRSVRASGDETIQYRREVRDGEFASVETRVVSGNGNQLPIEYRMHDNDGDGQWKVYDVVIEQVSIVNNYRAQFERVISKTSIKELLERMKHQQS